MSDKFANYPSNLDSPAANAASVTPNDSIDLSTSSRSLWIGGEGNLSVVMVGGQTVTFTALTVGWHPLRVARVLSTGTTATNIVAVW